MKTCGDSLYTEHDLFHDQGVGEIPTSPLQLKIIEIPAIEACEFNKKWHSRFPIINWSNVVRNPMYVCYSATNGVECFAVSIYSTPIAGNRLKNGFKLLELRRMAIKHTAPKNTASWMLGVTRKLIKRKFPECIGLISYQDVDKHRGTIYKASGWLVADECKFMSWQNRDRNKDQSQSNKVRWEYMFNKNDLITSKYQVGVQKV